MVAARGEAIFCVLITRKHPSRGFLFDLPRHLGEKKRALDYYVELFAPGDPTPYLLVQVKTTRRGYTRDGRLRVRMSSTELRRLAAYPAPTYVVGIDEVGEQGYIVSTGGKSEVGFSAMCTDHPLTPYVLSQLRDEVEAYWQSPAQPAFRSVLADPRWRQL